MASAGRASHQTTLVTTRRRHRPIHTIQSDPVSPSIPFTEGRRHPFEQEYRPGPAEYIEDRRAVRFLDGGVLRGAKPSGKKGHLSLKTGGIILSVFAARGRQLG